MPGQPKDTRDLIIDLQKEVEALTLKVDKIKRRLTVSAIYGVLKALLILIPLIISIWYFQPQIRSLFRSWVRVSDVVESFANGNNADKGNSSSIQITPEMIEQLQREYPQLFQR